MRNGRKNTHDHCWKPQKYVVLHMRTRNELYSGDSAMGAALAGIRGTCWGIGRTIHEALADATAIIEKCEQNDKERMERNAAKEAG